MSINNLVKIFFLLIILSIEIKSQSLIPRYGQSSVLVDNKIFFFWKENHIIPNPSPTLNQVLYLDVSKPLNTTNPPFEEIPNATCNSIT